MPVNETTVLTLFDKYHDRFIAQPLRAAAATDVYFTYSVFWTENKNITWQNRWDKFLLSSSSRNLTIHWVSLGATLAFVLCVSYLTFELLRRAVKRDVSYQVSLVPISLSLSGSGKEPAH